MKLKNLSPATIGFLQTCGILLYVGLLVEVINFLGHLAYEPGISGMFMYLFFFCCSALTCGLITFGYPAYLAFAFKNWKNALLILCWMTGWMIAMLIVLMVYGLSVQPSFF